MVCLTLQLYPVGHLRRVLIGAYHLKAVFGVELARALQAGLRSVQQHHLKWWECQVEGLAGLKVAIIQRA